MPRDTKNSKRIIEMDAETARVKSVDIEELRKDYLTLFGNSLKR